MSHATPSISFISPVTFHAGEAETALCPRLIVSAINSRPLAVYLRMSVFIQYAQRNLSHWLHALVAPVSFVRRKVKLSKGATHERGNFIQERGFFSQGADDD
ncbi:hypothetical protein KHQ08_06980 [Pseudochrobactrum algeriensis]|uniref:hypothetical protein n=1 Tax=Pseudochrobactrum algeriensis TaxID=2834768 RepID=UPI001BD10A32|nr:hypothetical protein [Pseudochrobactrum algeriensis]QVQ37758.1 hypothetical protein KHQ08_06980 [Pseudochrobactrum algeriensis]QVQ40978.1 hypothetical protein KHQ07_05280 [Pseudochrobactrum algeriensis]QVQ44902.1 hypothetical protein KHQ09_07245 [Pseudochrobactrum algeriensis]